MILLLWWWYGTRSTKKEYQKYLESVISITSKVNLREALKEYIDSGYVLTELKDGYAFLEKPEEARQLDYYKRADVKFNAVVNPQGKIITDFIYHCDFKTIEEFNSNKGESFFQFVKVISMVTITIML